MWARQDRTRPPLTAAPCLERPVYVEFDIGFCMLLETVEHRDRGYNPKLRRPVRDLVESGQQHRRRRATWLGLGKRSTRASVTTASTEAWSRGRASPSMPRGLRRTKRPRTRDQTRGGSYEGWSRKARGLARTGCPYRHQRSETQIRVHATVLARGASRAARRKRWTTRVGLRMIFVYREIFRDRQRRHSAFGVLTPPSSRLIRQPPYPMRIQQLCA